MKEMLKEEAPEKERKKLVKAAEYYINFKSDDVIAYERIIEELKNFILNGERRPVAPRSRRRKALILILIN